MYHWSQLTALRRGEIDVGFGRVYPAGEQGRGENQVASRLVRLEPVDAVMSEAHPLAERAALRPADLREGILWSPAALDKLDFLQRFADYSGIAVEDGAVNLGLDHLISHLRADRRRFTLLPADIALPENAGVRSVPLTDPTPLYAWSLIWLSQDRHPLLRTLLRCFAETGRRRRWLEYDATRDWLPAHARAGLERLPTLRHVPSALAVRENSGCERRAQEPGYPGREDGQAPDRAGGPDGHRGG
jgi:hypothetical protein